MSKMINFFMKANCVYLLIWKNPFMLKEMTAKFKSPGESLFAAFNATLHNTIITF